MRHWFGYSKKRVFTMLCESRCLCGPTELTWNSNTKNRTSATQVLPRTLSCDWLKRNRVSIWLAKTSKNMPHGCPACSASHSKTNTYSFPNALCNHLFRYIAFHDCLVKTLQIHRRSHRPLHGKPDKETPKPMSVPWLSHTNKYRLYTWIDMCCDLNTNWNDWTRHVCGTYVISCMCYPRAYPIFCSFN